MSVGAAVEVWGQVARVQAAPWEHPAEWLHDRARLLLEARHEDGQELAAAFALAPESAWAACTDEPYPAGGFGPWLRARNGRRTFDEIEEEKRRQQEAHRVKLRREVERYEVGPKDVQRRVATDPIVRADIARALGGVISDDIARRIKCPGCGRPDVWFALAGGWAHCNHQDSCSWEASVYALARATGATT